MTTSKQKADLRPVGTFYTEEVRQDGKRWRMTYQVTGHVALATGGWSEQTERVAQVLLGNSTVPSERKAAHER